MFTKIWQTVTSWVGFNTPTYMPLVKRNEKKERFLLIQDPYAKNTSHPSQNNSKMASTMPRDAQQVNRMYCICQKLTPEEIQQREIAKENDDFIFDMKKMEQVLKQIQIKQQSILRDKDQLTRQATYMLNKMDVINSCEERQRQIYRKYVKIVTNVIELKYSGEKVDFPNISYEKFKEIVAVWNIGQNEGKNMIVPGYDHLSFSHLRLLGPTRWLNDQVITQYIHLMNAKLSEKPGNSYVIFDSLKVTSLFGKADFTKLQKVLGRQKITRNTVLILAIHKKNHWLFIKLQNCSISIYDSINSSIQTYMGFPLIDKIVKFAQNYYKAVPDIERITNFPQQANGYDCGMMMLCGIKDLVRDYRNWSFSQSDINYKRTLLTKQLLQKQITGF